MAHHNVMLTNPQGDKRMAFEENVNMEAAKDFLKTYKAPIGWHYQLINFNPKPRRYPVHILITGFKQSKDDPKQITAIDVRKARVLTNKGWYSVKKAKRDMRAQGASFFKRVKVWENGDGVS